jgi:Rrf2 family transcriptional regulator, iron-sulfur cluster assembly transcription factor
MVRFGGIMSLISTRSRYGLRFLIDLAQRGAEGPIDLGSVAERQAIPETYLAKLVVPLRNAGIIRSARGAKGGYELTRAPSAIAILDVVEVLEGRSSLLECTDRPELCSRSADCPTLPIWTGLEKTVRDYLKSVTVGDAAAPRIPDYSI